VEGWYYFSTLMSSTVIPIILFFIAPLIIFILSCTGKRFYAHRIALLASSDAFRAMFDGGYRVSFEAWCNIMCLFWLEYADLFS